MNGKIIGAVLVIFGCGSFGFRVCANVKREELALRQLITTLDYMQCELQFRMTPMPDLCRQAGYQQKNRIGTFFCLLADELDCHISPDVSTCVSRVLMQIPTLPERCRRALKLLGTSLGRFDVHGQIQGMESVRCFCRSELESMSVNRNERLRSYQTLGICTGAALAILFV